MMRKCDNGHPAIYYELFQDDKPTVCPICELLISHQKVIMNIEYIAKQLYFKGKF